MAHKRILMVRDGETIAVNPDQLERYRAEGWRSTSSRKRDEPTPDTDPTPAPPGAVDPPEQGA